MRAENIESDLRSVTFEFFYNFSRFEFALKENGILRSDVPGNSAEPGWSKFIALHQDTFVPSQASRNIVALNPLAQKIGENTSLVWEQVFIPVNASELKLVVTLLKTTRNNLFHGGKSGAKGWDDPVRTMELLKTGIEILNELAEMAAIQGDYLCHY